MKQKNPFFSIIIPVYNVEKFLCECVDSVLKQTFTDWELILINDGSTDNSGYFADNFAKQYPKKIYVYHRSNHGLLATRRYGLTLAKGSHYIFLDSDDSLAPKALEVLYEKFKQYSCDCIIYGVERYDSKKHFPFGNIDKEVYITDKRIAYRKILLNSVFNSIVRKSVKSTMVNTFDFSPFYHILHGEDLMQTLEVLHNCNNILFLPNILYKYRINPTSITNSVKKGPLQFSFEVREQVLDFLEKENVFNFKDMQDYHNYCMKIFEYELKQICRHSVSNKEKIILFDQIKQNSYFKNFLASKKYKNSGHFIYTQFRLSLYRLLMTEIIIWDFIIKLKNQLSNIKQIKLINKIKILFIIIIQYMLRVVPINKHKIFSINYFGQGYADNGKYICNEIIKNNPNMTIIQPLLKNNKLGKAPLQVKSIKKRFSLKYYYHLATSKIWLSNTRISTLYIKRKNQYYIQLWHGSPALKKIETDAAEVLSVDYVKAAKYDSKIADLFISNSKYWTKFIPKTFWYNGQILECGLPRLDPLYNSTVESKNNIKKKLNIIADKVLLYAPTFRSNKNIDCYSIDYEKLKHTLEEKTGKSWHLCVRLHPTLVNSGIQIPQVEGITDLSRYPDIYEILEIFDIMFDVGFYGTPVILFATDIEKYKMDRNFYFKLEELPFPITTSNEELFEKIKTWNSTKYKEKLEQFKNELGVIEDGKASKRIIEYLKNKKILD